MLDELKSTLDVTLSYVARSLGLQRSAVYKWYQGSTPWRTARALKRSDARGLAHGAPAVAQELLGRQGAGQAGDLGDLLSGQELDLPFLRSVIRALAAVPQAAARRPRLGFPGAQTRSREGSRVAGDKPVRPARTRDVGEPMAIDGARTDAAGDGTGLFALEPSRPLRSSRPNGPSMALKIFEVGRRAADRY